MIVIQDRGLQEVRAAFNVKYSIPGTLNVEPQLLVEIAIKDGTVVVNAQYVAAHQFVEVIVVEVTHQQVHVRLKFASSVQKVGKPLDWHICHCVQGVEFDAKSFSQLFLVFALQFALEIIFCCRYLYVGNE
jgi:hypothetical protein